MSKILFICVLPLILCNRIIAQQALQPKLVKVKGGNVAMKNDKGTENIKSKDLNDFWIGCYEVTNQEFIVFLNDLGLKKLKNKGLIWKDTKYVKFNNGKFKLISSKYNMLPVNYASWLGAKLYCEWLSEKTGEKYRLPTELEWEYAAKGGDNGDRYIYSGSSNLSEIAWYAGNSEYRHHFVGEKRPNKLGIYDMSGNVREWCNTKKKHKVIYKDIIGVLKGGNIYSSSKDCEIWKSSDVMIGGFRIVKE